MIIPDVARNTRRCQRRQQQRNCTAASSCKFHWYCCLRTGTGVSDHGRRGSSRQSQDPVESTNDISVTHCDQLQQHNGKSKLQWPVRCFPYGRSKSLHSSAASNSTCSWLGTQLLTTCIYGWSMFERRSTPCSDCCRITDGVLLIVVLLWCGSMA